MKLDDFIAQTLTAIVQGVRAAQAQTKEAGGIICPQMFKLSEKESIGVAFGHQNQPVSNVTFDVVVTTSEKAESHGALSVFVVPVGAGQKGASRSAEGSESRI